MTAKLTPQKHRIILDVDFLNSERTKATVEDCYDHLGLFRIGWSTIMDNGCSILNNFLAPVFMDVRLCDDREMIRRIMMKIKPNKVKFISISPYISKSSLTEVIKVAPVGVSICMATPLIVMNEADFAYIGVNSKEKIANATLKILLAAQSLGIDAVMCAPEEIAFLRTKLDPKMTLIAHEIKVLGNAYTSGNQIDYEKMLKDEVQNAFLASYHGADYISVSSLVNTHNQPNAILDLIETEIILAEDKRTQDKFKPTAPPTKPKIEIVSTPPAKAPNGLSKKHLFDLVGMAGAKYSVEFWENYGVVCNDLFTTNGSRYFASGAIAGHVKAGNYKIENCSLPIENLDVFKSQDALHKLLENAWKDFSTEDKAAGVWLNGATEPSPLSKRGWTPEEVEAFKKRI